MSVLKENIRFCHLGTSQQCHIYTEKVSVYSSFVWPVHDSPGNTDTTSLKAHLCQQLSHMTFIKGFLFPEIFILFKGSCASSAKAVGCSLMCLVESLQKGPQTALLPQELAFERTTGKKQGLCSPGHTSVGFWMQMQEVGKTFSLLLSIRSHLKLHVTWPFITMCLICPGLTILFHTTILL